MRNIFEKFREFCLFYQNFDKTKEINKDIITHAESMRYLPLDKNINYNTVYKLEISKEDFHNVKRKLEYEKIYSLNKISKEDIKYSEDGNSLISYSIYKFEKQKDTYYKIARIRDFGNKEKIEKILYFDEDSKRYNEEIEFCKDKLNSDLDKFIIRESYSDHYKHFIILTTEKNKENKIFYIELPISDNLYNHGKEELEEIENMIKIVDDLLEYKTDKKNYCKLYNTSDI